MEIPRTQSINVTDPAELGPAPNPAEFTIFQGGEPVRPITNLYNTPELRQIINQAIAEGRPFDDRGRTNLGGLSWKEVRTGPDDSGKYSEHVETFVIRDQYTKHEVETRVNKRESVLEFARKVLNGSVTLEQAKAEKKGSFKPTKPVIERKQKIHKTNSRHAIYGTPKTNRFINKGKLKKTWIPRPYVRDEGPGPTVLGSRAKIERIEHNVDMLDIEVFDHNNNHVRTESRTLKDFTDQLHKPDGPREFSLSKEIPAKATAELATQDQVEEEILQTPLKDPYEDISNFLKEEGLPDSFVGITWTRDGLRHHIIDDTSARERERDRTYDRTERVRKFRVRLYDANNNIVGHEEYRDAELKKYFKNAVNATREHGLTTKPVVKKDFIPLKHITRISAYTPEAKQPRETSSTLFTMWNRVLNYRMLDESDVADIDHPRKSIYEMLKDPETVKLMAVLNHVVSEHSGGREGVKKLAEQMRDTFGRAVTLLELPAATHEKSSSSWALREMLEMRYYSEHPDEVGTVQRNKYGLDVDEVPDPFANNAEGVQARRLFLEREIATHYLGAALKARIGKMQKTNEKDEPLFVDGDPNKPAMKEVKIYSEDTRVTARLLDIAAEGAMHILNKVIDREVEDPSELSGSDLIELGHQLLRQFPDRELKK